MTEVNPAASTGTSTTSTTSSTAINTASIGEEFNNFLQLLTAQIKNQDPLSPLDSTQFVEQLATFSNLELQATTNQILEGISNLLASAIGEDGSLTTNSAAS